MAYIYLYIYTYSDILPDILSGIDSDILHTFRHIFWHSFWHVIWHYLWHHLWHAVYMGIYQICNRNMLLYDALRLVFTFRGWSLFFGGLDFNSCCFVGFWFMRKNFIKILPIGSMYGIYTNIGCILMVNFTIYSIHGSYWLCPGFSTFFYALGFATQSRATIPCGHC